MEISGSPCTDTRNQRGSIDVLCCAVAGLLIVIVTLVLYYNSFSNYQLVSRQRNAITRCPIPDTWRVQANSSNSNESS